MKVAILYTLSEEHPISYNPGDDIVRDGQRFLLSQSIPSTNIEYVTLCRYSPASWFSDWHRKLAALHPKMIWPLWPCLSTNATELLRACDVLINASGPLLYAGRFYHSIAEPWFLLLRRILKADNAPKFLNLGFGVQTQQNRYSSPLALRILDYLNRAFTKRLCNCAEITCCRDKYAYSLARKADTEALLLPCPSLFACEYHGVEAGQDDYIALNFKPFPECGTQARISWTKAFSDFVEKLRRNGHKLLFIMHESRELDLAQSLAMRIDDYIIPKSIPEFLSVYGRAKVAVSCRIHGVYAAASQGVPSLGIGIDTRLDMLKQVGLPAMTPPTATAASLYSSVTQLLENRQLISEALLDLKNAARKQYIDALRPILSPYDKT